MTLTLVRARCDPQCSRTALETRRLGNRRDTPACVPESGPLAATAILPSADP